jgi:hypothetical protein
MLRRGETFPVDQKKDHEPSQTRRSALTMIYLVSMLFAFRIPRIWNRRMTCLSASDKASAVLVIVIINSLSMENFECAIARCARRPRHPASPVRRAVAARVKISGAGGTGETGQPRDPSALPCSARALLCVSARVFILLHAQPQTRAGHAPTPLHRCQIKSDFLKIRPASWLFLISSPSFFLHGRLLNTSASAQCCRFRTCTARTPLAFT